MINTLEIKDLVVRYGSIDALNKIDLEIKKGSIVALVGKDGSGKTTILKTIAGIVRAKSGQIILEDEDITNKQIYQIAKRGIIASFEDNLIIADLTVEDNLKVGSYSLKAYRYRELSEDGSINKIKKTVKIQKLENLKKVFSYFPILEVKRKEKASKLSKVEKQMLAIGRALMASPKILLLDEPLIGLGTNDIKLMFKTIKEIQKEGITILLAEENIHSALEISTYIYELELGEVKKECKTKDYLISQIPVSEKIEKEKPAKEKDKRKTKAL